MSDIRVGDGNMSDIREEDQCPGADCTNPKSETPHTCPFREEIEDDGETECWCCAECVTECEMGI